MISGEKAVAGRLHPTILVDRGNADRVAGFAGELGGMVAHGAPVPFAEGMNGVDLVDVVAEPIEKLVARKPPQAALRSYLGEPLVEFARDVGDGGEARSALGDVNGAILARPIVEVLEQVPMEGPIAIGRRWKGQARGLRAARLGQSPFGLCKRCLLYTSPSPRDS